MTLEFSRQIFQNSNIKFYENPSSGSRAVPFGQTVGRRDITKLTVAFRNFANAPNKPSHGSRKTHIFTVSLNTHPWFRRISNYRRSHCVERCSDDNMAAMEMDLLNEFLYMIIW